MKKLLSLLAVVFTLGLTTVALDAEAARHQIKWLWVKGHAGHVENERADALARRGVEAVRKTGRVVESEEAAGVKA